MWSETLPTICLVWYIAVIIVSTVGYIQLVRHYSKPPPPSHLLSTSSPSDIPHVTVIRPVKGLEPSLYECLASTFQQKFPAEKLTIYLCVSSRQDTAIPTLKRVLADFPKHDAKIFIEEDDPVLNNPEADKFGPNPKIRNMSRAYREAKGDIIWIVDCNVWVAKEVAGRMIDVLYGLNGDQKYKFVHQLPLVIDTSATPMQDSQRLVGSENEPLLVGSASSSSTNIVTKAEASSILSFGGGRLEEMFMSSSHAKFYTAINTVLIAPCIVGKSSMFRRSHLNYLTRSHPAGLKGLDYFSENICEDHMIGDLLWKKKIPEEEAGEKWGKHALVFGDLAIQPMAGMSVKDYIARRVRWLRVRKLTVMLATLVEHGTESYFCSLYGAFAITTLPWFHHTLGVPPTWTSFFTFWLFSVTLWAFVDRTLYCRLQSAASIDVDENTPEFARPPKAATRRPLREWLPAWLGRETLAFPIWAWAVFGGLTVTWRGKEFWIGLDLKVHEIKNKNDTSTTLESDRLVNRVPKSRRD